MARGSCKPRACHVYLSQQMHNYNIWLLLYNSDIIPLNIVK